MTTALAPAPITTFTAPDPYPGLPAFWEALDAWLWAAQFGQMQRMWAGMRLHSERVKAANARTVAQMQAVEAVPPVTVLDGETEDRLYEDWRDWRADNGRSNRWQNRNGG